MIRIQSFDISYSGKDSFHYRSSRGEVRVSLTGDPGEVRAFLASLAEDVPAFGEVFLEVEMGFNVPPVSLEDFRRALEKRAFRVGT